VKESDASGIVSLPIHIWYLVQDPSVYSGSPGACTVVAISMPFNLMLSFGWLVSS